MTTPTTDHTAEREVVRASDAPARKTDGFFGWVRTFTQSVLPPALCIYLAILLGRTVAMDSAHDWNTPMVIVAGMILAAAFGPNMFDKYLTHRETIAGKDG